MAEKHKTMLLLDAEVWRRFQEEVLRSDGGRATSTRVEKLIAATDPARIVTAVAATWPSPREGFPAGVGVERRGAGARAGGCPGEPRVWTCSSRSRSGTSARCSGRSHVLAPSGF